MVAALLALAVIVIAGGVYLLVLVLTPHLPVFYPTKPIEVKHMDSPKEDRVYIPKVGIDIALLAGGADVLDKGAWHRLPDRGDPVRGGNFIISAHRFSIGTTPAQTRQKSPFYHIDKLAVGDKIIVDYQAKRYSYEIIEIKNVKPNQIEIEAASNTPKLTLYTCTLKGETDGRQVFIAKPLGNI